MNPLINRATHSTIITTSRSFSTSSLSSLSIIPSPPLSQPNHHDPPPPPDPFRIFTSSATSKSHILQDTQITHTHLLKTGLLHSTPFVDNTLFDRYCKAGAVSHAEKLFDEMPHRNVVSCNVMISGYNRIFRFYDSWRLFCGMWGAGFEPNEISYGCVLFACAAQEGIGLGRGRQVYSLAVKNGFLLDGHVRSGMIDLFAKNQHFEDALRVFGDGFCENVVTWNSMISGAVKNGENWAALDLFHKLCHKSLVPSSFTFSSVLTACAALEELEIGKGVHGLVIKYSANDVFVETAIVDLYAKCGDCGEAVKQFSQMPIRNVVSWTAIISGFVRKGDSNSALNFFKEMRRLGEDINNFTVTSVAAACAKPEMTREAIQIHGWCLKAGFTVDPAVGAALINVYSKAGDISLAEMVFREMDEWNRPGIWAVMISSYSQDHAFTRAFLLFIKMLQKGLRPDEFCCSALLSVTDCILSGRQTHCHSLKAGILFHLSVASSLFTMYSKCGSIEDSFKVFEQIPVRDNVSWTSMIAGVAEHGCPNEAFGLFKDMLLEGARPDKMTLIAVLTACSSVHSLRKTKEVHGYAFRAGISLETLGGAFVASYSKCGALSSARKVFDMPPEKDQVSWTSLVSGYAQNGLPEDAVFLFREMLISNFVLDSFTITSVLYAITHLSRAEIGIQLHALITKMGLDSNVSVGSSLVAMYSKCGSIEDCYKAFNQIHEPDLISFTAMIMSYAQHGKGEEALRMYEHMRRKRIRPDSVTFVAVLSACSHTNLVEEGYLHFNSMIKDFGIEPSNCHYVCMVDLLGRSGRLKEAEKFINSMPTDADALVWATLLAACKVHGDIELGKLAARRVMELDPSDSGAYISLSNICADIGQWEEVLEIRSLMRGTGVRKETGWSLM